MTFSSSSTTTTIYVSIPEGRRLRGRVKEFTDNDDTAAEQVHPGKPHRWHEMTHYGKGGTGFAQCRCGAMGVPYSRTRPMSDIHDEPTEPIEGYRDDLPDEPETPTDPPQDTSPKNGEAPE